MKNCNECGFLENVGTYEYYEGGCCVPEGFLTCDGCLLKFQEVKKLSQLFENVKSLSYYGYKYYEREMTPELEKEEEKDRAEFHKADKEYDEYLEKLKSKYKVVLL